MDAVLQNVSLKRETISLKRETMVDACKAINTLRLILKPAIGSSWSEIIAAMDEIHEVCFETSTRFVYGHNDLVELPEDQLKDAQEWFELLTHCSTPMDPQLGQFACQSHFEKLDDALGGCHV